MIFTSSRPIETDREIEVIDGLSHVRGDPSELRFARDSVVTIHSWGTVPFSSMKLMFDECEVTILCNESPVFAPGCSLWGTFAACTNFNQDVSRWDTSNVTDMKLMFFGCVDFGGDLSSWDTSNVTDMSFMFHGCRSFNRPLRWNVSNVTNMSYMFFDCRRFNQRLHWNTSKVTDMSYMFCLCASFSREPIWDTLKVANMKSMFDHCTALVGVSG